MESRSLVLFIESAEPVRLAHLATLVMSAVLLDRPVTVVWTGGALAHLMSGGLDVDEGDDSGSAGALLKEARVLGDVGYLACSADARRLGLDRAAFLARLDDVLAMTTILIRIEGAGTVLYL